MARKRTALSTSATLQFMRRLWDLAHALDVRSKQMAKTLGVTGPQRLVIRVVGQAPGCNANEISTLLNLHPSTLSGILSRLEAQGMLVRAKDPEDARRACFTLTGRGRAIDRERKGTVEAAVRRALARADAETVEEAAQMIDLLVEELVE